MNTLEMVQIHMHFETKTMQHYHGMFVLIYFWKIQNVKFVLQCFHFVVVVRQRLLFDKLEKAKEQIFTVF